MSTFVTPDARYVVAMLPAITVFCAVGMFAVYSQFGKKVLLTVSLAILVLYLGAPTLVQGSEAYAITLKKQIGLNYLHPENPWNYMAVKDQVGGGIAYNRVTDGQIQQTAIQRTDAFAALVRSVVGTFYKTYIATGKGPRGFLTQMVVPGDGRRPRDIIAINPMWASFYKRNRYGRYSRSRFQTPQVRPIREYKVERKKAMPRKHRKAESK